MASNRAGQIVDDLFFRAAQLYGVTLVYALVLTVTASPALLWLYRSQVSRWMARPAGTRAEASVADDAAEPRPALAWRTMALGDTGPAGAAAGAADRSATRRLAWSYAAGGAVHALVMTGCLGFAFAPVMTPTILGAALLVFLLPTLATVLHLTRSRPSARAAAFAAAGALLYAALGIARGLGLDLFVGFVLPPTVLLLLFSLRYWRGVAPLVWLVSVLASLGAVAAVLLARYALGADAEPFWRWRAVGFGAGLLVGVAALRIVVVAYERHRFSDEELFIGVWWLLYTMLQVLILAFMKGEPIYFVALGAFIAMELVRRAVWKRLDPGPPAASPRHLLLLRVFADDGRTEALFARLERRWRHIGGIRMIAGRDLALRNIGPADFLAFITARLRDRFVGGDADLQRRLQALDERRDPDGRYRVHHFWCHADTWRPTMRALEARCDAVLMDLRGFTAEREGCRYELQHLARQAADKPVVLLVDDDASIEAVRGMLQPTEDAQAAWRVAKVQARSRGASDRLFDMLLTPHTADHHGHSTGQRPLKHLEEEPCPNDT